MENGCPISQLGVCLDMYVQLLPLLLIIDWLSKAETVRIASVDGRLTTAV